MGNQVGSVFHKLGHHQHHGTEETGHHNGDKHQHQTAALQKLFEKLELTADGDNAHPGELSKATFENAFQGSVHNFGKLMYLQMVTASSATQRERITREQFVKVGKEILRLHEEKALVKYYFHLFASGKDHLTQEAAVQMFEMTFALTLSLSKISHSEDARDAKVFEAMATGLFGIHREVDLDRFASWHKSSCPGLFECVHGWVTHILTGSTLPTELEHSRVPLLEAQAKGLCMAVLWLLSTVLPPVYTKQAELLSPSGATATSQSGIPSSSSAASSVTKDPMLTSMLLMSKMARLPQCESWKVLYNSQSHGTSMNRFGHHVVSYNAPNISFFTFEGRNLYCVAVDTGWSEGARKFGGPDCRLIQLLPVFRVVQAGSKMVRWNSSAKDLPKGIQVGCDGQTEVLLMPPDFDRVMHYGVQCQLFKLEVWGCGSDNALESQRIQKKWEASSVKREQNKKLRPYGETWDDTPDKQLLQWGGVNVGNHSYNR